MIEFLACFAGLLAVEAALVYLYRRWESRPRVAPHPWPPPPKP